MGKGGKGHSCEKRKRRQQIACVAVTVVLVVVIIVLAVLYLSVYKPKDPRIQVPSMQLSAIYPSGYTNGAPGTTTQINVTLVLQVAIYNPNRATFILEDGGVACLFYAGQQVGFTPLPPSGSIPAQSLSSLSVPLTVQGSAPLQLLPGQSAYYSSSSGILILSTTVTLLGRVKTLNLFSHHSNIVSKCDISISLASRSIVSYTCQKSFSLDP